MPPRSYPCATTALLPAIDTPIHTESIIRLSLLCIIYSLYVGYGGHWSNVNVLMYIQNLYFSVSQQLIFLLSVLTIL